MTSFTGTEYKKFELIPVELSIKSHNEASFNMAGSRATEVVRLQLRK